jgi:hypothetical protein
LLLVVDCNLIREVVAVEVAWAEAEEVPRVRTPWDR